MQADYLILADAVAMANNKQYIHGAGWDRITASSYPSIIAFGVAARLAVTEAEQLGQLRIELDVVDAGGTSILPDSPGRLRGSIERVAANDIPADELQHMPLAFMFNGVPCPAAGRYAAVLRVSDVVIA